MVPPALFVVQYFMPPITVTLTESEACHIRELVQEDREASLAAIRFFPNGIPEFHEVMAELDSGILEKFKDA